MPKHSYSASWKWSDVYVGACISLLRGSPPHPRLLRDSPWETLPPSSFFPSLSFSHKHSWTRHPALLTAAPMKLVATYGRSSHQHRSAPPARLSRNNLLTSVALFSLLLLSHWEKEKKTPPAESVWCFFQISHGRSHSWKKKNCFNFLLF